MLGGRAGQALKQSNPAAYYAKYVAPQLDRPGMAGAAANVERQRLLKTITNQAVNPGLDIRPSPGTAVVAMPQGVPVYGKVQAAPAPSGGGGGGGEAAVAVVLLLNNSLNLLLSPKLIVKKLRLQLKQASCKSPNCKTKNFNSKKLLNFRTVLLFKLKLVKLVVLLKLALRLHPLLKLHKPLVHRRSNVVVTKCGLLQFNQPLVLTHQQVVY
jgi:hypothetical protein